MPWVKTNGRFVWDEPSVTFHEITGKKVAARCRRLARSKCADCAARGDAKCDLFDKDPERCKYFEKSVLPLNVELEGVYWDHLQTGSKLDIRQCEWDGCLRESKLGGDNPYCPIHADENAKRRRRQSARKRRKQWGGDEHEKSKL